MATATAAPYSTVGEQVRYWLAHVSQAYNPPREVGTDIALPMGTPVYSLTAGQVLGAGYYAGGGVVSVRSLVDGITRSVYYQHLDTLAVQPGQVVAPGSLLGTSGGQLSGGSHPSTPTYSSGPHIEVGLDAPHGALWSPLGSNVNPIGWLRSLGADTTSVGTRTAGVASPAPAQPLGLSIPGWPTWLGQPGRIGKALFGGALLLVAITLLLLDNPQTQETVKAAVKTIAAAG